MTLEQFNNLKVGDEIYLPDSYRKNKFMSTEVLEINKKNQTIKAFMNSDKFCSYKDIEKSVPFGSISYSVGLANGPRMVFWKTYAILNSDLSKDSFPDLL